MARTTSISDYVASDDFRAKMKRVSAASKPFGNSASGARVYRELEKASKRRQAKSGR